MLNRHTLAPLVGLALLAVPSSAHFVEGQMYVIDYANDKIFYVNAGGSWNFVELPAANWPLNGPAAMEFTAGAYLLISNFGDNEIVEFNGHGGATTVLTAADGLDGPSGGRAIAIGPGGGDIFVSNSNSGEILRFSDTFASLGVFADPADGLVRPEAMSFLADGHLLVVDAGASSIVHFEVQTGMATPFDTLPNTPVDLAIRDNQDVLVLDDAGNLYRYAGGDPGARSLLGTYGSGNGSIAFSLDHSLLYHTNPGDSAVREIDPVTGADSIKVVIPGAPTGLAVMGGQFAPGTYIEFGDGLAGTGGVEPLLQASGQPRIGQVTNIEMKDFVGGTTMLFFYSAGALELPILGGEFHPDLSNPLSSWLMLPAGGAPGVAGAGGLNLGFAIPNVPFLAGSKWYLQAIGIDAVAPQGVSFTNCLTMYVGN